MSRYCLDTSAYSQLLRGEPQVSRLLQQATWVGFSPVALGELRAGFRLGSRPERNEAILRDFLSQPTVVKLTLDESVSEVFADLFASQRRKGQPVPTNDLWIAGQAVVSGCPVLTFDKHFRQLDGVEAVVLGA